MSTPRNTRQDDRPRLLYSRKEAAYQLSISLRALAYLITEGRIAIRKIGGGTKISHEELVRFSRRDHPDVIARKKSTTG